VLSAHDKEQDMPTTKQAQELEDNRPYRTGPNVDAGLEAGAVTVDPETAAGIAAENARKANGAKETETDNGVVEVRTEKNSDPQVNSFDTIVANAPALADQRPKSDGGKK
jgi:hypothetical protein